MRKSISFTARPAAGYSASATKGRASASSSVDVGPVILAGLEAHRAGDLDRAESSYRQALHAQPNHADALNLAGALAFARGESERAIKLINRAIKAYPGHLDAHLNLAEALESAGRLTEAIEVCQRALVRAPDFVAGHARVAKLRSDVGDNDLALAHARVALALDPRSVEACCAQGKAFQSLRRLPEADAAFRKALALDPKDMFALTGMAALMNETDFTQEAARLYGQALEQQPQNAVLLAAMGAVLERDGDLLSALDYFDRALSIKPNVPDILYRRGTCLRDSGDFLGAEDVFRRSIALSPDYSPAMLAMARMNRLEDTSSRREQLGRILNDPSQKARIRVQAGFALGEVLDRAGEADTAFDRFTYANKVLAKFRESSGETFNRNELTELIDYISQKMAIEYAQDTAGWGIPTELPVFVVGMPRSGTTLVEQICASHSQVVGAGELRSLQMMARLIGTHNHGRGHVGDWDADFSRAQANRHIEELKHFAGGAIRVVDKTPLNLMRLGLIGALYPKSRVIWVRRDPRDVVISNHLMYFGKGNLYSTDQADCAFAVREIERLGMTWARELKISILEINYEELVADLETNVRRVIQFLGVPWEPGCLDFHTTERHVTTPSSWQVRQPIYSSSIGRWRRYEQHLGPMFTELARRPGSPASVRV